MAGQANYTNLTTGTFSTEKSICYLYEITGTSQTTTQNSPGQFNIQYNGGWTKGANGQWSLIQYIGFERAVAISTAQDCIKTRVPSLRFRLPTASDQQGTCPARPPRCFFFDSLLFNILETIYCHLVIHSFTRTFPTQHIAAQYDVIRLSFGRLRNAAVNMFGLRTL